MDYLILDKELAAIRNLIATVARLASLPPPPQATATPPVATAPAPMRPSTAAASARRQGRKQQAPSAAPTGTSTFPAAGKHGALPHRASDAVVDQPTSNSTPMEVETTPHDASDANTRQEAGLHDAAVEGDGGQQHGAGGQEQVAHDAVLPAEADLTLQGPPPEDTSLLMDLLMDPAGEPAQEPEDPWAAFGQE